MGAVEAPVQPPRPPDGFPSRGNYRAYLAFGFGGLALATPLTAAALVFVKRLYIEDVLGDTTPLEHEWRRVKTTPDPASLHVKLKDPAP